MVVGNAALVRLLGVLLGVVLVVNVVVIAQLVLQQKSNIRPGSEVLALTSPVYSVEGTVVDVKDSKLTVDVSRPPDLSQGTASAALKRRFEFDVPQSAQITYIPRVVPYSFKQTQPDNRERRIPLKAIRPGNSVVVSSEKDLRLSKNFTASVIRVLPQESYFVGFVKNSMKSRIEAEGNVIDRRPDVPAVHARYSFAVSSDTEIVKLRSLNGGEKAEKAAIDTIPSTTPVTIYYDGNPESGSAVALLIRFSDWAPPTPPASILQFGPTDDTRVSSPSSAVPPSALPSP